MIFKGHLRVRRCFGGASTDPLDKASHLTPFWAWDSHLPVTPAQLMRHGYSIVENFQGRKHMRVRRCFGGASTDLLDKASPLTTFRGRKLTNFVAIRESFLHEIGGCGIFWQRHQQAIRESFLHENLISAKSWKFSPSKVFPLYGIGQNASCTVGDFV